MKRQGALLLAGVIIAGLCGPALAQDYLAYDGTNAMHPAGPGGEMKTVNGIDFWMSGTPPKAFQVLGSITDERHASGIWGMISMSNLDGDIVKLAKKAGGDAVVLADAHNEVTGVTSSGMAFGNSSCSGMFCNGSAFGGGDSSLVKQHDSKYWVVKYLPDVPVGTAAPANAPGGDKATLAAAIIADAKAAAACTQQVWAMPEFAPLKDDLPMSGQENVTQLTNTAFMSDQEVAAFKIVYPHIQACHIVSENEMRRLVPGLGASYDAFDPQGDAMYDDLQNKKLNWGDFLRKRRTVSGAFVKDMSTKLAQVGLS